MDSAPPILTKINSTYLECTLHSAKYHCLLRLQSNRSAGGSYSISATATSSTSRDTPCNGAAMGIPDISSLSAIPIYAGGANVDVSSKRQSIGQTNLLPKFFNDIHTNDKQYTSDDNETNGKTDNETNVVHPSHVLVRIARDLEVQLKERLKDASDGAMHGDNDRNNIELKHSSGLQEEFLLRSEAILQELLSAVEQQLRKEQVSNNRQNKKRKASEQTTISTTSPPPLKYYSALVRQLQVVQSMPNVSDISLHKSTATGTNNDAASNQNTPTDLTNVSVTCLDGNKRSHTWHAELYPSIVLTLDLPSEFVLEDKHIRLERWWEDGGMDASQLQGTSNTGLPRIHHHFEQALHKYQQLFDELDDLDSHLWILEPSLPARRSSVERRIALWEGGASLVIVLDPENARGIPVMVRFLGLTMAAMAAAAKAAGGQMAGGGDEAAGGVVDWRTSFAAFISEDDGKLETSNKPQIDTHKSSNQAPSDDDGKPTTNPKRWSEERSVRENLELWFGSPLPSPLSPSTEKSDFLVECGICYAHRLPTEDDSDEGPLPEAKCSNPSCNRHYHESCLFEWLHSLPTARVSFDRIFGSCPYCCEAVSVKILNSAN
ncbi:hypothetical protein ACHAXR_013319 [Thalassiosira sp. AJA248-18]